MKTPEQLIADAESVGGDTYPSHSPVNVDLSVGELAELRDKWLAEASEQEPVAWYVALSGAKQFIYDKRMLQNIAPELHAKAKPLYLHPATLTKAERNIWINAEVEPPPTDCLLAVLVDNEVNDLPDHRDLLFLAKVEPNGLWHFNGVQPSFRRVTYWLRLDFPSGLEHRVRAPLKSEQAERDLIGAEYVDQLADIAETVHGDLKTATAIRIRAEKLREE